MEGPLLSKGEHIVDTTLTNGDSSSDDEHIVHITADADSPSTYEQTPHEAKGVQWSDQWRDPLRIENVCNLIEFCLTLVQIVVARVVVTRAEAEHGEATLYLYPWIVGYTCLCIATLPILCWRFCHYNRCVSSVVCNTIDEVVDFLKWVFEYFFLGWVALFFLWFFIFNDSSSLDNTTQLFWLCMVFLAFISIRCALSSTDLQYAVILVFWPPIVLINSCPEDISLTLRIIVSILGVIVGIIWRIYNEYK